MIGNPRLFCVSGGGPFSTFLLGFMKRLKLAVKPKPLRHCCRFGLLCWPLDPQVGLVLGAPLEAVVAGIEAVTVIPGR